MADKEDLSRTGATSQWTAIDTYLRPLRRRSAWRRRLSARVGEPSGERYALSATLPFVALAIALGVITLAIVSLAWPGRYSERTKAPARAAASELGTAPPGWIDG